MKRFFSGQPLSVHFTQITFIATSHSLVEVVGQLRILASVESLKSRNQLHLRYRLYSMKSRSYINTYTYTLHSPRTKFPYMAGLGSSNIHGNRDHNTGILH